MSQHHRQLLVEAECRQHIPLVFRPRSKGQFQKQGSCAIEIGNRLLAFRRRLGLTQFDIAEASDISPRAYANIERGETTMRVDTALNICNALHITPNDLFLKETSANSLGIEELLSWLNRCTVFERDTALALIATYMQRQNSQHGE